jgi:autotransporter-associated beta strand protein
MNMTPATVPNAIGAEAIILSNQTTLRNIVPSVNTTIGTLRIDNSVVGAPGTLNNTVGGNNAIVLTFDADGAGPAQIFRTGNAQGTGANVEVIRGSVFLEDDLVINVDLVKNDQAAIALNFIQINGTNTFGGAPGKGVTKNGTGTLAFADTDKAFSGPLVINQGRIRLNAAATMSQTSAVTINSGGQLVRENAGDISYGLAGTILTLNGMGLAAFPGALRTSGNVTADQIVNMPVVLQSTTAINVVKPSDAAATRMVFANPVSGAGGLVVNSRPGLPIRSGQLVLQTTNAYSGGTTVEQGSLYLSSADSNAGSGGVFVSGDITNADSALTTTGKLIIEAGVTNGIANTAYLNLTGGGAPGVADQGSIELGPGVVEVVGGLMLGGIVVGPGTYGSSTSTALPTNPGLANPDEFFAGDGIISVVPAGVPGDYNANGVVDSADYVLWRNGGPLAHDFTPGIQQSDYDFWRSQFAATTNPGSGSGLGAAAAVPEPSMISLVGLCALLLGVQQHRRIALLH